MADLRKAREARRAPRKPEMSTKTGALARLHAQRNGSAPTKGALGALKAKRAPKKPALARAREERRASIPEPTKRAVTMSGLRFDRCRRSEHGDWWLVDVSNNDKLVTFHNRYGSWMHDPSDGADRGVPMTEPEAAFSELANQSSPRHITIGIFNYWVKELHHLGLPATQRDRQLAKEKAEKEAADAAKAAKAKPKPKPGALSRAKGKKTSAKGGALAKLKGRRA